MEELERRVLEIPGEILRTVTLADVRQVVVLPMMESPLRHNPPFLICACKVLVALSRMPPAVGLWPHVDYALYCKAVLAAVTEHRKNAAVQVAACRAIKCLSTSHAATDVIIEVGAAYTLALLLLVHKDNPHVATNVLVTMSAWVQLRKELCDTLLEANAPASAAAVLVRFKKLPMPCEAACMLLRRLCLREGGPEAAVAAKAVPNLLQCLPFLLGHTKALVEALLLLNLLFTGAGDVALEQAAAGGAVDLVAFALRRHPDHEKVQEYGCLALAALARLATVLYRTLQLSAVKLAVAAIRTHARKPGVVARACELLEVFALYPRANVSRLKECGVPFLLVNALRAAKKKPRLLRSIASAIAALSLRDAGFQAGFHDLHADETALECLKGAGGNEGAAAALVWALNNMTNGFPERYDPLMANSLGELLVAVLRKHAGRPDVVYPALQLLGAIAREDEAPAKRRTTLLDMNVIDPVVEVLRTNATTGEVMVACFRLLRALSTNQSVRVSTMLLKNRNGISAVVTYGTQLSSFKQVHSEFLAFIGCMCHLHSFLVAFAQYAGSMLVLVAMRLTPDDMTAHLNGVRVLDALLRSSPEQHTMVRSQDGVRLVYEALHRFKHNTDFMLLGCSVLLQVTGDGTRKAVDRVIAEALRSDPADAEETITKALSASLATPDSSHLPQHATADDYYKVALELVRYKITHNAKNPKIRSVIERVFNW